MNKMLFITQREKEQGGRGWISYTTQKAELLPYSF